MRCRIPTLLLLAALACMATGRPALPAGLERDAAPPAAIAAAGAETPAVQVQRGAAPMPPGRVAIPAGVYRPLYKSSELNRQRHDNDSSTERAAPAALRAGDSASNGEVRVERFYLDVYPVTNADYLAFVQSHAKWRRSRVPGLFADEGYLRAWAGDLQPGLLAPPDRPVVNVSWFAARAYCAGRGGHLPTTAQWEHAAAASETAGDGAFDPAFAARILAWYGRPTPAVPAPVGSVYRNVWGVYDLHGLVWEWVRDFNTALVSGESRGDSGLERRFFCAAGSIGAVNVDDYAAFMRYAFRSSLEASYTAASLGFRCAQDGP
jgi:formylglycine-generating enzyme required for sulfatase activity